VVAGVPVVANLLIDCHQQGKFTLASPPTEFASSAQYFSQWSFELPAKWRETLNYQNSEMARTRNPPITARFCIASE
jgi:hypothetical protein